MGPTEKSFNQVKAILGKLDRSIDEVRARRTSPAPIGQGAISPVAGHDAAPAHPALTPSQPAAARPGDAAARPGSPYGRATPLNQAG